MGHWLGDEWVSIRSDFWNTHGYFDGRSMGVPLAVLPVRNNHGADRYPCFFSVSHNLTFCEVNTGCP